MNAEAWRARLEAANTRHTRRLERLLALEFQRLASEIDATKLEIRAHQRALADHQQRVGLILATQQRATAATFGFLTLEMIDAPPRDEGVKADQAGKPPPTRAERIAVVLTALARTVAKGAEAVAIAELIARDRSVIATIEVAILAEPAATPAGLAASVLRAPRVAAALANAQAAVSGVEAAIRTVAQAAAEPAQGADAPITGGPSGGPNPPPRPPSGSGGGGRGGGQGGQGGGPSPRRSRFSLLVERLVREQAPQRARRIAATSGRAIAAVLGEAAANGWGQDKTARALRDRIAGDVSLRRGRVIARTELGAAQNGASLALALDREAAGESDLVKAWASVHDERRRPTHRDAEGQVRGLIERFHVGDSHLLHPGDPNGELREIIQCRCAMLIYRRTQSAPALRAAE